VGVLDPGKRVNYSLGLVLGVDEFRQEQTYFLEKHRRHNRTLHGHGTVWGLKLSVPAREPPEIHVAPGLAATLAGHEICVPTAMCAQLDQWLDTHRAQVQDFAGSAAELELCVVLCHRDCPTDVVPLPGEPCRSEGDVMASSRLSDSFELKLVLQDPVGSPPERCPEPSARETGLHALTVFLNRVHVTGAAKTYAKLADVERDARRIGDVETWVDGVPESAGAKMYVHPDNARVTFNSVARVWATEVLPALLKLDGMASCAGAGDRCVLLGDLRFAVATNYKVVGGSGGVTIDETRRPILLSTEVLQEWAIGGGPQEHVRVRHVPV
jgi:hypothetical protein